MVFRMIGGMNVVIYFMKRCKDWDLYLYTRSCARRIARPARQMHIAAHQTLVPAHETGLAAHETRLAAHETRLAAHNHHVCAANQHSRAGLAVSCAAFCRMRAPMATPRVCLPKKLVN